MSDGIKYDEGKPKIGMVVKYFAPALMEVAKAGTFGCAKYGNGKFWDFNWNRVENGVERYTDALMRHLLKEDTEKIDPETGILHASLVAWNALARLVLILASATTRVDYYPYSVAFDEGIPTEEDIKGACAINPVMEGLNPCSINKLSIDDIPQKQRKYMEFTRRDTNDE